MKIKRAYELRTKNYLSISDVSKALSITDEQAVLLEQEDVFPHRDLLQKLAKFYNVSVEYLIGTTDFSIKENITICSNLSKYISDRSLLDKCKNHNHLLSSNQIDGILKKESTFTYENLTHFAKLLGLSTEALLKRKK